MGRLYLRDVKYGGDGGGQGIMHAFVCACTCIKNETNEREWVDARFGGLH